MATARPPGSARAWFNVVFCGVLCVGVPIVFFLQSGSVLLGTLLALAALAGTIAMEVHFVRILRSALGRGARRP